MVFDREALHSERDEYQKPMPDEVKAAHHAFTYELWHGKRHGSVPWLLRVQRMGEAYATARALAAVTKAERIPYMPPQFQEAAWDDLRAALERGEL